MKKALVILIMLLSISSCSIFRVHKDDIEQGNIMTPDTVNRLHTGMSMDQVKDIMGTPMLVNTFTENRVDYVYTFKPAYGEAQEKYLTLIFRNGKLKEITGNMYSAYIN